MNSQQAMGVEALVRYSVPPMSGPFCHSSFIFEICKQYSVIQIKICAEYRDMLPRPRLVCQEPGLRPIGRSPGVPDKSSPVNLFYSIHFPFFFVVFFVGLVGNCA